MDYQKLTLIGNATHDAEVKTGKESGKEYGDFRMGVRTKKGDSTYYSVRCFGRLVNGLSGIKRGTRVFVEGDFEPRIFTGDDDKERTILQVVAQTYRILGNGRTPAPEEASSE